MAVFPRGNIWPDAIGTVTTLTAAYVPSTFTFEVHEQSRLLCMVTLPALATIDPALQVRVDFSLDSGVTWHNGYKEITIPGYEVGEHRFFIDLPHNWHSVTWRVSARDILADADTTCVIYAESVIHGDDRVYSSPGAQPIELATAQTAGVLAWHAAGVAAALGLNFAYGPAGGTQWVPVGRANEVEVWATTTGGPPTSIELQVEESMDDGVTVASLPFVNNIVGGIANLMPNQIQLQSAALTLANGTYVSTRIPTTPGSRIRLAAKRTGAAVNLLARFRLFRSD